MYTPVERQVVPDGVLPALVGGAVVGVVLGDVAVDAAERELLVGGGGDGLHDELRVRVGRLGVVTLACVPRVAYVAATVLGGRR